MGVSARQTAFRDAGIGIVQTHPGNSSFGPLVVTQDFACQTNEQAQVVGVAYYDTEQHGLLPARVQGRERPDRPRSTSRPGQVTSTQTWGSGGYELSLAPGQYQLIASQNNQVIKSSSLSVGSVNVEQDYVLTSSWQGGTLQSAIAAAQPSVTVPVAPQPSVTTPPAPQPVHADMGVLARRRSPGAGRVTVRAWARNFPWPIH